MIKFHINNNKKNLILFIHGFTGAEETWAFSESINFPTLLSENTDILKSFDIAYFNYFTELQLLAPIKRSPFYKLFKKVLGHKNKKNISICEISNLLRTEIKVKLGDYDNLIIIAHSMGGLIAKDYILNNIEDGSDHKVAMFISLAVPHSGSELATFAKLFSSNINIQELAPIDGIVIDLNNKWVNAKTLPQTKYFYGTWDEIVNKKSAIGINIDSADVYAFEEDHTSICKPENKENTTFKATEKIILNISEADLKKKAVKILKLTSPDQYEDEFFVLKLLVANVHNSTVKSVKEHFLNAEYVRKLFKSKEELSTLSDLYKKIESLYADSYGMFLSGVIETPEELVATVHEKIVNNDQVLLKTILPILDGYYKKGMLHQLANEVNDDTSSGIWWTKERSLEKLKSNKK